MTQRMTDDERATWCQLTPPKLPENCIGWKDYFHKRIQDALAQSRAEGFEDGKREERGYWQEFIRLNFNRPGGKGVE